MMNKPTITLAAALVLSAAAITGAHANDQTNNTENEPAHNNSAARQHRASSQAGSWTETGPAAGSSKNGADAWMTSPSSWATFNGDLADQKYSPARQITPDNVEKLEKVWEYHTGDVSDGSGDVPMTVWSATPLFINDTLYIGTPFYRIIALNPATGKAKWTFDPHAKLKALTQPDMKNRGVAYWQADEPKPNQACQKMVYIGTMDAKLYAVDADTGKKCVQFGDHGVLNVNKWNTTNDEWPLSLLQPPTVYHDTLYLGWAGKDWAYQAAPPGTVFALDARTGKRKWTFHALPKDAVKKSGTANVWASMTIDPATGLLYIPVSSPSPNFYGGNRLEKLPLASSVTALNADTGKVVWSRQLVHHDIWDYDTAAPPTLLDIRKNGKTIPALVQTSKMGYLFVLNRKTGQPVYPIEEKPFPKSNIQGEKASPTQPVVAYPKPTIPDHSPEPYWLSNAVSFGGCGRRMGKLRNEGKYTPPSLRGSMAFPPSVGGSNWGGGAVDPNSNIFVVNSSHVAFTYRLIKRADYRQKTQGGEASGGYHNQKGAPYGVYLAPLLNWAGMPCWKPPYGTIAAYDMNTGKRLWNEPFGQVQKFGFYMPKSWGSVTLGGPVITRSGLIFIGASMDSRVRALDIKSGKVVWRRKVDAPAVAIPAVYTYKGREYVTFVVGGNSILLPKVSDQVVTYALPDK